MARIQRKDPVDGSIDRLVLHLAKLYEQAHSHKFPNSGCKFVSRVGGVPWEDIIPDLDLHFSNIADYCSWGKKVLAWPTAKVISVRRQIECSFIEKHPHLLSAWSAVSEENTPDLCESLAVHEEMRLTLISLLNAILHEREQ